MRSRFLLVFVIFGAGEHIRSSDRARAPRQRQTKQSSDKAIASHWPRIAYLLAVQVVANVLVAVVPLHGDAADGVARMLVVGSVAVAAHNLPNLGLLLLATYKRGRSKGECGRWL